MSELYIKAENTGHHEQISNIRIGKEVEYPMLKPHVDLGNPKCPTFELRRPEVKSDLRTANLNLAAIGFSQQVLNVRSNDINDFFL